MITILKLFGATSCFSVCQFHDVTLFDCTSDEHHGGSPRLTTVRRRHCRRRHRGRVVVVIVIVVVVVVVVVVEIQRLWSRILKRGKTERPLTRKRK